MTNAEAAEQQPRDLAREHDWLATAAREDTAAFVDHAEQRLDAGQETYGDAWAYRGARGLLRELLAEAADLGAWGALADQALDLDDDDLGERARDRVRATLALAARCGAQAHAALMRALDGLDRLDPRDSAGPAQHERETMPTNANSDHLDPCASCGVVLTDRGVCIRCDMRAGRECEHGGVDEARAPRGVTPKSKSMGSGRAGSRGVYGSGDSSTHRG